MATDLNTPETSAQHSIRLPWWRNEDWLAVGLGFLIIALVLIGVRPQLPTFKWATTGEFSAAVAEARPQVEGFLRDAEARGEAELLTEANVFKAVLDSGDRVAIGGAAKKLDDASKKAKDAELKSRGQALGNRVRQEAGAAADKVFSEENIVRSIYVGIACLVLAATGIALTGGSMVRYVAGFPVVFALSWLSQVIAGNSTVNYWGLEYVIFALLIGLIISNTVGVPAWVMEAVRTEYYIKTGLVILGAGILFGEILQAGVLGMIQALAVVTVVWYLCFWLSRRLRVDDGFAAMLSTAVSICGVSAAIAACGAIEGDRKKLSYVTSLVLIVAIPMMVLQPWIIRAFGIPEIVGGAWLGGTLDTTGSVVAAGSLVGERAMKVGTIVKFSQNVLIGAAAFLLSIWWTLKKGKDSGKRPSPAVIWERFPKFVLGFLIASVAFSFLLQPSLVKETKGLLGGLRTTWFALAFTSIGLETRFGDLVKMEGGRPALAFVGAQAFNVFWTLLVAFLLFGGIVFPVPDFK